MKNAKGWTSEKLEKLAFEIYEWLIANEMWIDIQIFYDGKRMSTSGIVDGKTSYRYNGEPFIDEADPHDYFEYAADPHILSMTFEGPLYEVMNFGPWRLKEEFDGILRKHGLFAELGNAWNLTCYECM